MIYRRIIESLAIVPWTVGAMALTVMMVGAPQEAHAQGVCEPDTSISGVPGGPFNVGDLPISPITITLAIGAEDIDPSTFMSIPTVNYALDCEDGDIFPLCVDDGGQMGYIVGNITTTCEDALVGGNPVVWTTPHAGGTAPNTVVFTAGSPAIVGPNTTCDLSFTVELLDTSTDTTPSLVEVAGNYTGTCDQGGTAAANPTAFFVTIAEPSITLLKEVSLNGGGFFDANDAGSAVLGPLPSSAEYRLTAMNDGTDDLENVVLNDATLGLVNVPLPVTCLVGGVFEAGDSCVITSGDIGYTNLGVADVCDGFNNVNNQARVDGDGVFSTTSVFAEDPANVRCVDEGIQIIKLVSVDGGLTFDDANAPPGPDSLVGAVVFYQLVVENIGETNLINVEIDDVSLGLVDVPLPVSCLVAGEFVPNDPCTIESGEIGFEFLEAPDRCTAVGTIPNTAFANGTGAVFGTQVMDDDPANVNCVEQGICLTKTPGFWKNHGHVADDFTPVTVCGNPINNVSAGNTNSTVEAMCVNNKEATSSGTTMTHLQLRRHLTAAKLNIAASITQVGDGACSSFELDDGTVVDVSDLIMDAEALCNASAQDIKDSGFIGLLDAFNNSDDTLDPFGPFVSPGPADSTECRIASKNGVVVP